jgi:DNA repair protein RecO (recombination protein O)
MQQTVQGIILQNTKYQDKKNILKIYTLQHGLQSYAIHLGHSKTAKIKPAHVLALNQIEFIEHTRKTREVQKISEMNVTHVYQQLFSDLNKNCIAVFLNEVLIKSLKEHHGNEELYFFISEKLKELDRSEKNISNFHLHFLIEFAKHLGFYPNNNYTQKNCLFDLQEGIFTDTVPLHPYYTDSETSFQFNKLIDANFNDVDISFSGQVRGELLQTLLLFYRLHVPNFGEVKSVQVLKEVLA